MHQLPPALLELNQVHQRKQVVVLELHQAHQKKEAAVQEVNDDHQKKEAVALELSQLDQRNQVVVLELRQVHQKKDHVVLERNEPVFHEQVALQQQLVHQELNLVVDLSLVLLLEHNPVVLLVQLAPQ